MENFAYQLKIRYPKLFQIAAKSARGITVLRFRRRLIRAIDLGIIQGTVQNNPAEIRPLCRNDALILKSFFNTMSESYLQYFHPHSFDERSIIQVLRSLAFLNYGLWINKELTAYGLLKISPFGSAYMGQLVSPKWSGLGLGKFLVAYLYWQAYEAGLAPKATISRNNQRSLRAHASVARYNTVAELPNNYIMIEFPEACPNPPLLEN